MKEMASLVQAFIRQLEANPAIVLDSNRFDYTPSGEKYLPGTKRRFEEEYGFEVPDGDAPLLLLPSPMRFDIAWSVPSYTPRADWLAGEVCLCNPARSLSPLLNDKVVVADDVTTKWARHAYQFEVSPSYGWYDPTTVLVYDAQHKSYKGLYILFNQGADMLPLSLGWNDYLRAALQWHGAPRWPFLYLPLNRFQALAPQMRAPVAKLRRLLPQLFPDADWSILSTKQAYFESAEAARQEIAALYPRFEV